jgi:hypothetical protein
MPTGKNTFTAKSPQSKANSVNNLRNGNPNWTPGRPGNPDNKNNSSAASKRRKLFTEFLNEFYHANPAQMKKLVLKCHKYAMDGHARFAELIIDRLEGPVKHDLAGQGTTFNFNFVSDVDRQRALESVDRIKAMTITVPALPEPVQEKTEDGPRSDAPDLQEPDGN